MNAEAGLDAASGSLRRWVYGLLILASLAAISGRLFALASQGGTKILLSANDRSRWCTVRALLEEGTYAIDNVILDKGWQTIDMVRHKDRDGRMHFYSSKPPLLATLLAGLVWIVQLVTRVWLVDDPPQIVSLTLVLVNVLPMGLYLVLVARLVDRLGTTDAGRMYVVAAAAFGTYLFTFAVTLNNHSVAAVATALALHAAVPIWLDDERNWGRFFWVGLWSSFAATNELPALAFFAALAAWLTWKAPWPTWTAFVPASVVVLAAFMAANYVAHDSWRPPYAHRSDGPIVARLQAGEKDSLARGELSAEARQKLAAAGVVLSPRVRIEEREQKDGWTLIDAGGQAERYPLLVAADGQIAAHVSDNWYDYDGTYWTDSAKRGVDRGEPSSLVYVFHVLVGHHGVFSLTPVWILSAAGAVMWLQGKSRLRGLIALVAAVSLVCLLFYLARPLEDRNYGGVTSGFRWVFWLAPLWLILAVPAADWIAARRGWREAGLAGLFLSIFSAAYAPLNPWTHPWLMDYLTYLGWIEY
jgi:hypothetical protein